jgi:tetratricopeptide (TPR) repeat protein
VIVPAADYGAEGNFGGISVAAEGSGRVGHRVRVTPIDSLKLKACHVLKIDVEGFEPEVLRGARETIARCRPYLYVENDRVEHQQEVISLIHEMGYRQYWHTPFLFDPKNPNGNEEDVFPGIASVNLFCIPNERKASFTGEPIDPDNWTCPMKLQTPGAEGDTPSAAGGRKAHPGVAAALSDIKAGRYADAERRLSELAKADPKDHEALHALGALYHVLGRDAEAEASLRAALRLTPGLSTTCLALGGVLLSQGKYLEGFPYFEARHDVAEEAHRKPEMAFPEWRGEPLAGKSIMIWPEEGLGDQMQFARFAPWLRDQGARVAMVAPPPLYRLFADSFEGVKVFEARGQVEIDDPDYWVMSNSIVGRAKLTPETLPNAPYLRAARTTTPAGARIGVVGRGNPVHANDANRSLPDALVARLLALPGAISLAPTDTGAKDFADTAAIVDGLDLVISVDTSVAHLAAGMGKPTWILLPFVGTDWRWMRERADSPWYPSARLIRQPRMADWETVVAAIEAELAGGPAAAAKRPKRARSGK